MDNEPKAKSPDSQSTIVRELHPFAHIARIPEGADLSSVRFEGVKLVKVATESRSIVDESQCQEASNRDPSGSISCSYTESGSTASAYEVTYSYLGQPLASDEYGSNHFTFNVYFRPDELSPAAQLALSDRKTRKAKMADFFKLNIYSDPVQRVVIDYAASAFCNVNFVDGLWIRTDPKCNDQISYKTSVAESRYTNARVDPVSAPSGLAGK